MASGGSELQNLNEDALILEIICRDCRQILSQPAAFTTVFEAGLSFQKTLTRLRSVSRLDCQVCALFRSVDLEDAFTGRQGDESYRFGEDLWRSPRCTFTLKAVVDTTQSRYTNLYGSISILWNWDSDQDLFGANHLDLVIRPESPTPHLEFARKWLDECMVSGFG